MDNENHGILLNEIRYAQRITQRTARLYRRLGTFFTFMSVIGGGGLASSLSATSPYWLVLTGGIILAVTGAAALAIRPIEKAILNEQDVKKYANLEVDALGMDTQHLTVALAKARQSDVAEIELLRDVAYNDVVRESGHPEMASSLTLSQRFMATLA